MGNPAETSPRSGRVLISYAHDDPAHQWQVLELYEFLRAHGVDALIDVEVAARPQYWPDWMSAQIRQGGYVRGLVRTAAVVRRPHPGYDQNDDWDEG